MTVDATRAPKITLVAVSLCFTVKHVAGGTDCSPHKRIGAKDGRAQRAGTAAKQRLFARVFTAGRKARACRQYENDF